MNHPFPIIWFKRLLSKLPPFSFASMYYLLLFRYQDHNLYRCQFPGNCSQNGRSPKTVHHLSASDIRVRVCSGHAHAAAFGCCGQMLSPLSRRKLSVIVYNIIMMTRFQLAPGDDIGMSYMYSLLNYIAATNKDSYESAAFINVNPADQADYSALYSVETGLRGLAEDEKRLIGISTISVVTRLALEFDGEEVCIPGICPLPLRHYSALHRSSSLPSLCSCNV